MGNYTLIAKNVTYIYEHLKKVYPQRYTNENEHLVITGMIDVWRYLKQGQLRIRDVLESVKGGKLNHITLSLRSVPIYEPFGFESFGKEFESFGKEKDPLLGFTLNLEARIFRVDSRVVTDEKTILYALLKKRDQVLQAIQKTRKKSERKIPKSIIEAVDTQIHTIDLDEIKKIIIESELHEQVD